jgi:hypothetical protein
MAGAFKGMGEDAERATTTSEKLDSNRESMLAPAVAVRPTTATRVETPNPTPAAVKRARDGRAQREDTASPAI